MRICDKCMIRHGAFKLTIYERYPRIYDLCDTCVGLLETWFKTLDQHEPEVPCTNCNKEEGWVEENNN